jgi:hypothetical protein
MAGESYDMRIVFVPLDDRPLNYAAMLRASEAADAEVLLPPRDLVGSRYHTPSLLLQARWLAANCNKDTHLILSLDALLHGGLVQARSSRTDRERTDNALMLIGKLTERSRSVRAYYVLKRLWGNIFRRKELERTTDWEVLSRKLAAKVRSSGKNAADFYKTCTEDDCGIDEWPSDEAKTFARHRLSQLDEAQTIVRLCSQLGIQLHIAVEDSVRDGVQEAELEYLLEGHVDERLTVADGADEAGAVLLAGILAEPENDPLQVAVRDLKAEVAPYESRPVMENLRVLARLAGAELSQKQDGFVVEIAGKPEPKDPYPAVVAGEISVPEFSELLESITPLKEFNELRVIADLTVTNGVNAALLNEFINAERMPLTTVQCNTASNRIGHAMLLGRLLQAAPAGDAFARLIVSWYIEDLMYFAYLRTWVATKHGGLEPADPRQLAAAENSICSMAQRCTHKKFAGAQLRGKTLEIGEIRLHLPWQRWFEAEADIEVTLK